MTEQDLDFFGDEDAEPIIKLTAESVRKAEEVDETPVGEPMSKDLAKSEDGATAETLPAPPTSSLSAITAQNYSGNPQSGEFLDWNAELGMPSDMSKSGPAPAPPGVPPAEGKRGLSAKRVPSSDGTFLDWDVELRNGGGRKMPYADLLSQVDKSGDVAVEDLMVGKQILPRLRSARVGAEIAERNRAAAPPIRKESLPKEVGPPAPTTPRAEKSMVGVLGDLAQSLEQMAKSLPGKAPKKQPAGPRTPNAGRPVRVRAPGTRSPEISVGAAQNVTRTTADGGTSVSNIDGSGASATVGPATIESKMSRGKYIAGSEADLKAHGKMTSMDYIAIGRMSAQQGRQRLRRSEEPVVDLYKSDAPCPFDALLKASDQALAQSERLLATLKKGY